MQKNDVAISTEAGRAVASNLQSRRQQAAQEARAQARADLTAQRADTTTPLVGRAPLETLPEPPKAEKQTSITIEVAPDGLHVRCEYTGTLASIPAAIERLRAAGVLDLVLASRVVPATAVAPLAAADDLPEGWKLCKKHGAPMRPRNKQNEHWHSHNVGTSDNPCWCKGYKGADSPGYEL